jgi:hypothetical protein
MSLERVSGLSRGPGQDSTAPAAVLDDATRSMILHAF